jgi:nicotinamide-nucleotide amidase
VGGGVNGSAAGGDTGDGFAGLEAAVFDAALAFGRLLERAGATVVAAESCTGGVVARALTEAAGSSAWFECGFVTYSNASKQRLLGVAEATLAAHGAVSEPVAREMAAGALMRGHGRIALSVTGIAGPGGAVAGKPVGTVCFGWAYQGPGAPEAVVRTATRHFDGDRRSVRLQAALEALAGGLALWRAELADRPPAA